MVWHQSSTPLTIALTGASAGGILLLPSLVALESRIGFRQALLTVALVEVVVVGGLALLVLGTPDRPGGDAAKPGMAWVLGGHRRFWLLAGGLAVMITVQVGVLVHHLNRARKWSARGRGRHSRTHHDGGAGGAGGTDRVHRRQRSFGAERTGLAFVLLQVGSLVFLCMTPHQRLTLTIGSVWFGLSVGVLITPPTPLDTAVVRDW